VVATTTRGSELLHFRDGCLELHSTEALKTRADSAKMTFKKGTPQSKLKGRKRGTDIFWKNYRLGRYFKNFKLQKQVDSPFRHNS
jgi:hypothetical protein